MIDNYSRVRLCTNRFQQEGIRAGSLGYVIEVYDDGAYEVEFSDANGVTIAQVVARENGLQPCEPAGSLPRPEVIRSSADGLRRGR